MVRFHLARVVGVVLICSATVASGFDVPLKYRTREDKKKDEYRPTGYSQIQKSFEAPGEFTQPDLKSRQPIYGIFEAGDQRRLMILDRTNESDGFYSRLYFDADGDGDLTNDPVHDGEIRISDNRNRFQCDFSTIDTKVRIGDHELPYCFEPVCIMYSTYDEDEFDREKLDQRFRFYYRVYCNYSGEFTVDSETYQFWLADSNGNGRFDDVLEGPDLKDMSTRQLIYPSGDSVYMTAEKEIGYRDRQAVSDWLSVGGKLFVVRYLIPEGKMMLEEYEGEMHPVAFPLELSRVTLATENWEHCVNALRPGESIRVPEGTYHLVEYEVYREDPQGDLWRLHARGTKDVDPVEVGDGENARLGIGEPYRPLAQVPESYQERLEEGKERIRISLTVLGAADEVVDDIYRMKGKRTSIEMSRSNSSRPKEPEYEIFDSDGEIVAQGDFDYG
jgi:hypothetical protein